MAVSAPLNATLAYTRGEQTALIEEMIEGEKVVKAFGYEKRAGERFAAVNDKLQGYSLKAIFFSSITNPSALLLSLTAIKT